MAEHREIERTYAPPAGAALPELTRLPGVAATVAAHPVELEAVYHDTVDLALTRAGVSLRRRVGGDDEGWHLKVPADEGRDEVHEPLGRADAEPPPALRSAVLAWTWGAPLAPVATVRTLRSVRSLVDGDGRTLAELSQDEVEGTAAGDDEPVRWTEWELELVDAGPELLQAADRLMERAGVPPSQVTRKVIRALGARAPRPRTVPEPTRTGEAAWLLHQRLAEQVAELLRRDSQIRRGRTDEGVHRARIACRRLRSALATCRPLVDREVTDPIRDELRWLGRSLAPARDDAVAHGRLRGLLDAERSALLVGPVHHRLDLAFREREEHSRTTLEEALDSERYLVLLGALDRLVSEPPWTEEADRPADEVLLRRVRKDWKRLRRRVDGLQAATDRDAALHQVRKDAKRLRYAAETLRPAWGRDAHRLARAGKVLTSHLGEHQDTVAARARLLEVAGAAEVAGEPSRTWGALLVREEHRAAELDDTLPTLWRRVSRKKLRRWLR